MNNSDLFPFERNRYFYGKMLTARDFQTEQRYFNNKRRLINRAVFGAGVVCGLGVYKNDDESFSVETGMALDYHGREIALYEPVIKKLRTVDGYENLEKSNPAYLCLKYSQNDIEPVNSIGAADSQGEQYNKIGESFKLYLSTDEPNFTEIFGKEGMNTVFTAYSSEKLKIIATVPALVISGEEFPIGFTVLKGADTEPVSFTYRFESEYFKSSEQTSALSFRQEDGDDRDVINIEYFLRAAEVSDMAAALFDGGKSEISVSMGDFTDRAEVTENPEIYICKNEESFLAVRDTKMSTLEKRISGGNTPIYLAKIDCMSIGAGFIIRHITPLPFNQRISRAYLQTSENHAPKTSVVREIVNVPAKSENFLSGGVNTEVETLEYWRKPQVSASYSRRTDSLNFRFGIPSSEAYDYATASGEIDIPISGAIRVNARFVSKEIPHTLGLGDVSVTASVEFEDADERCLLFGNGDVFGAKNEGKSIPKVETAVVLYPDRGTFKVGIQLSDYIEGHSVKVRWFAYKPTRDTAAMKTGENITVKITPDIQRLAPLERIRFKAEVEGSADKEVIWSVSDENGGSIDENGLYQAPSEAGTYEIVAVSNADETSKTSAFVIVGD